MLDIERIFAVKQPVIEVHPDPGMTFTKSDHPTYSDVLIPTIALHGTPPGTAKQIDQGMLKLLGSVLFIDDDGRYQVNKESYPTLFATALVETGKDRHLTFLVSSFVEIDLARAL